MIRDSTVLVENVLPTPLVVCPRSSVATLRQALPAAIGRDSRQVGTRVDDELNGCRGDVWVGGKGYFAPYKRAPSTAYGAEITNNHGGESIQGLGSVSIS